MSIAAIIFYGIFGVGYLAMILLTERSADHYVRGQVRTRPGTRIVIVPASIPQPVRERVTAPKSVRVG